jgi:hypothetical protein
MMVTLFNGILLFLHVGSASGVLPVRGALAITGFRLCPSRVCSGRRAGLFFAASASERQAICLVPELPFKTHSKPALTPFAGRF